MLRAAHHNLKAVVRLAALCILFGLCAVPVECASVYGPHSVFVSADAVAALRLSTHEHGAPAAAPAHAHSAKPAPATDSHTAGHGTTEAPSASTAATTGDVAEERASVPTTAGAAMDALISLAVLDSLLDLAARASLELPPFASQPVTHRLPAPEPPPP